MHISQTSGLDDLEVTAGGESFVIDYMNASSAFLQDNRKGGPAVSPLHAPALAALVTHVHEHHTDVAAIEEAGPKRRRLRPGAFAGSAAEVVFTASKRVRLRDSSLNVQTVSE